METDDSLHLSVGSRQDVDYGAFHVNLLGILWGSDATCAFGK